MKSRNVIAPNIKLVSHKRKWMWSDKPAYQDENSYFVPTSQSARTTLRAPKAPKLQWRYIFTAKIWEEEEG